MRKRRLPDPFIPEDGHPIPQTRPGPRLVYDWPALRIGQSVRIAPDRVRSAWTSASAYRRRTPGWDYRLARLEDGAARVWRTA